jgi:hypothetical protein
MCVSVYAVLAPGAVKIFFLLGALLVSAVHEIAINARVVEVPIIFSHLHIRIIYTAGVLSDVVTGISEIVS